MRGQTIAMATIWYDGQRLVESTDSSAVDLLALAQATAERGDTRVVPLADGTRPTGPVILIGAGIPLRVDDVDLSVFHDLYSKRLAQYRAMDDLTLAVLRD